MTRHVAVTMNNMAGVLLANGDADGGREALGSGPSDIFKKSKNEAHPHAIIARNMLAEVYRSQGRLAEAETLARETLAAVGDKRSATRTTPERRRGGRLPGPARLTC